MKTLNLTNFLILLISSLIIWSCSEYEPIRIINRLEAKAGDDQEVTVNTLVHLDGTDSKDGDNKPFNFEWKFKSKPPGSAAVLEEPGSPTPKFTPDLVGVYKLQLTITQNSFSKNDEVIILAKNAPDAGEPLALIGTITEDRVLEDRFEDPEKADYVVLDDVIVGAKLTVKPGVVIEFEANKSLRIFPEGSLAAQGSETEKIVLTGKVKEKGYWKGIGFYSNSADNELDHVVVAYAGGAPLEDLGNVKAGIALAGNFYSGAALKISNSSVVQNSGYGLYVQGRAQLNHFAGNKFNNNTGSAVFIPAAQLQLLDAASEFTGNNGFEGVETGGEVKGNSEAMWTAFNDGSKYLIKDDLLVESGVRIAEGAVFEFDADRMLKVAGDGYLHASGTEQKPIVFTAWNKIKSKFWKGIIVSSAHDMNQLNHAIVSYAGSSAVTEVNTKGNITVTASGKLTVSHSSIEHGLGWGIVTVQRSQINQDFITANTFANLLAGNYKLPIAQPDITTLPGVWMDPWSFTNKHYLINENYFNVATSAWFNGAADPWAMDPATGFGLLVNADGSYVWTIAERSPATGCDSWSAEYITGNLTVNGDQVTFNESFWRSRFHNACDLSQNVDVNVDPGGMVLRFEINQVYDLFTGEPFWELKIINPDNSFFTYYRL